MEYKLVYRCERCGFNGDMNFIIKDEPEETKMEKVQMTEKEARFFIERIIT